MTPFAVTVDATAAYVTTLGTFAANFLDGSLLKIPFDGTPALPIATSQRYCAGVAVDQDSVYWLQMGTGPSYADGEVMKAKLAGGAPVTLAHSAEPASLVVDAQFVYWVSTSTGNVMRIVKN